MARESEHGFALISAVWLLTLAASIAALLMLQSVRQARVVASALARAGSEQDMDDIVAQVMAAALFEGPRSPWGRVPAHGQLSLPQGPIAIAIDNEATRLDVNKAQLAQIDGQLHDRGMPGDQRAAILTRIAQARAAHRLIGTFADLVALGRGILPPARQICLATFLSPFSNAQDIASTGSDLMGQGPIRAGDTLRISVGAEDAQRTATIRLTGLAAEPYSVLDWYEGSCPSAEPS